MKLKAIKAHHYDSQFVKPGVIYMADKVHGGIVVRSGACVEVKMPKKKAATKKK